MGKGISVFTGMKYTLKENITYINNSKALGFDTIFTSLHIPEANYEKAVEEFKVIVAEANNLSMSIIADISPRAFTYLCADMNNLKSIKDMGLQGVRVDFGFSPKQISNFTNNKFGLKIEINASTVTERFFVELEEYNPNYEMLQSCHNYYPRLNTGLSINTFNKKNKMLKKRNIKISAFVPSLINKRGPIYEGLATLEKHRFLSPYVAAKELFALGMDNIIFGDSIPSDDELRSVGDINENILELRVNLNNCSSIERKIIFDNIHENRPDSAEDVIRSTNSRVDLHGGTIYPHDNTTRTIGSITIDNKDYLRYSGELQICKKTLPQDDRVNVVGNILKDDLILLKYIDDETKFKLK
ncbi:DUF871 domain-containing protein [Clostridium lacusfryxellense]|uniref:DUF871 domain-containing protein n=1 Tax=Clostridium lacusfryxellense TaxID=205328 RepID=UPI001C0C4905|nr:MupG family TIM beta-alpha barrel fold protein [Clostridium lacusfryxellense]MBU3114099.1 DUF871 family protein [Clostridium lacusfryxellense]